MSVPFTDLLDLRAAGFDAIIDVRSPAEFAEDHIPGAINLPVLSNEERARVGTIYTQQSPFAARKIGAALVARNAAHHIETALIGQGGGWRPLVYCWRGGQRSGSFASIVQQIGWRADTLAGGYQSYRRAVVRALYDTPLPHRILRLDGLTGTGKTAILHEVAERGGQTLDLEGLANHRGSILGDIDGAQPAQKGFESALLARLDALDPSRPVLVEAESARIGALRLPPSIWAAMKDSPRLVVTAPPDARAAFLAADYARLAADPAALLPRLTGLVPLVGHARVAEWQDLLREGAIIALARSLILHHYDAAYTRLRKSDDSPVKATVPMPDLSADSRATAAQAILAHL